MRLRQFTDIQQEIQIDATYTLPLHQRLAPSPPQFESFITADVEQLAAEVGQQLGVQTFNKRQHFGNSRRQRRWKMGHTPWRREFDVDFRQIAVLSMFKPAFHVTEAVLVGHEIDMPFAAIGIEIEYLLRCQRRGMLPYLPVLFVSKGMLHVELKLVDLPAGEPVNQIIERLHCGHSAAADIMHHAARREVGPIVYDQLRQGRPLRLQQLPQRLNTIENVSQVMRGNDDTFSRDCQSISLSLRNGCIQGEQHLPGGATGN